MRLLTALAIIAVLLLQGAVIAKEKEDVQKPTRYERIQAPAEAEFEATEGDPYHGCDWTTDWRWSSWYRGWPCIVVMLGGGSGGGGGGGAN